MLMVAARDDNSCSMVTSPSRLVRVFNETRVSAVVAKRLPDLGDTRSQLIRVLKLLREHSAELFLTEKSPAKQDLNGMFELSDALDELHSQAIKQGMERTPSPLGRPPADIDRARATEMRLGGASWRVIGEALGVGESTIRRHLHQSEQGRNNECSDR